LLFWKAAFRRESLITYLQKRHLTLCAYCVDVLEYIATKDFTPKFKEHFENTLLDTKAKKGDNKTAKE
jgi:hypothetical protein